MSSQDWETSIWNIPGREYILNKYLLNELMSVEKPPKEELAYFLKGVKSLEDMYCVLWEKVEKADDHPGENFT